MGLTLHEVPKLEEILCMFVCVCVCVCVCVSVHVCECLGDRIERREEKEKGKKEEE